MRKLVPSGVWELFVPDLPDGTRYKFEVRTSAGHLLHKADPYARRFETPPNTASVVWTESKYDWRDHDWLGWPADRVRVAYVIVSILSVAFPGIIIYLLLGLLMPDADSA